MDRPLRFLDRYHRGEVQADSIYALIDAWDAGTAVGADAHVQLHVSLGLSWVEYLRWCELRLLPTPQEHARWGRQDLVALGPSENRYLLKVHGPLRCRPACPIHWPSEHRMVSWPLTWSEDLGVLMRLCRHDISHPDPDDQQVRLHSELAEHDCDGCCKSTIDAEVVEALAQLDGTPASAVALLGGISRAELEQYGGPGRNPA